MYILYRRLNELSNRMVVPLERDNVTLGLRSLTHGRKSSVVNSVSLVLIVYTPKRTNSCKMSNLSLVNQKD